MTDWRTEKLAAYREKQRLDAEAHEAREAEERADYQGKFVDALLLIGIPEVEAADAIKLARAQANAIGIESLGRPSALFKGEDGEPDLLLQPTGYRSYGAVDLMAIKPCAKCARWITIERAFDPRPGYHDLGWILVSEPSDVYHECGHVEGDKNFVPPPPNPGEGNEPPTNEQRTLAALESIAAALDRRI